MKQACSLGLIGLLATVSASAQSLYDVGSDAQDNTPLTWILGVNAIYDDNVTPTGGGPEEESFALNPYVGASFVRTTPQTTVDLYARLGLIYYLDSPAGMEDVNSQSRLGLNVTHSVSERLRFSSRNFISYELEPDYSYGYATSRATSEYLYYQTDNSVGYRWTERFGTYTGFRVGGLEYDDAHNDRTYFEPYNQFRYQLTPQTVLTAEYRYRWTEGSGLASDTDDQYLLVGAEHRFNPNTIGVIRVGAQFHEVDLGDSSTSPYLEASLRSQVNQQFSVQAFARYGIEGYDTVVLDNTGTLVEYDDRQTFRLGVSGDYSLSQRLSLFGGIDYIPTSYEDGRIAGGFAGSPNSSFDESIFNAYVGFAVKFTDYLSGNVAYNFTDSSSDIDVREYDRNRISVGLSAEF
ncbi:MAG: hypothetical protein V4733_09770 [Verrucomicrobiota bacterium]